VVIDRRAETVSIVMHVCLTGRERLEVIPVKSIFHNVSTESFG